MTLLGIGILPSSIFTFGTSARCLRPLNLSADSCHSICTFLNLIFIKASFLSFTVSNSFNASVFLSVSEISFAQDLISTQKIACQEIFHTPECNPRFADDMERLYQEYKKTDKQKQYVSDMVMLIETYKNVGYKTAFLQSIIPIVKALLLSDDGKLNRNGSLLYDVPR